MHVKSLANRQDLGLRVTQVSEIYRPRIHTRWRKRAADHVYLPFQRPNTSPNISPHSLASCKHFSSVPHPISLAPPLTFSLTKCQAYLNIAQHLALGHQFALVLVALNLDRLAHMLTGAQCWAVGSISGV